jgi:hypothetical protein
MSELHIASALTFGEKCEPFPKHGLEELARRLGVEPGWLTDELWAIKELRDALAHYDARRGSLILPRCTSACVARDLAQKIRRDDGFVLNSDLALRRTGARLWRRSPRCQGLWTSPEKRGKLRGGSVASRQVRSSTTVEVAGPTCALHSLADVGAGLAIVLAAFERSAR